MFKERQTIKAATDRPASPKTIPDAMLVPNYPWCDTDAGLTVIPENFSRKCQDLLRRAQLPRPDAAHVVRLPRNGMDTFVVEATGFNDKSWLDDGGHPRTEAMKTTERFRRKDYGHLEIDVTVDDPKAYTKPFTVRVSHQVMLDQELIEFVCNENEKSARHYDP
jgi:hypothetical protein